MKQIRIVLVDEQKAVREGVKLLLNSQADLCVVGEAGNAAEALEVVRLQEPEVVLLEPSMTVCSGVALTRRIKEQNSAVKVIAFTTQEDPASLQSLLAARASGYVLRRSSSAELFRAIRNAQAGHVYCDPLLAGSVLAEQAANERGQKNGPENKLSKQEVQVLRLVAWGHSSKEIAGQLCLSVKTVETYRARVQRKLGLKSRPDIMRYALRQGWFEGDGPFLTSR